MSARRRTTANTAVEPVITEQELADWIGVDSTDPLLPQMAITATAAVIEYLYRELITRARTVIYEEWPTVGTDTAPSLSRGNQYADLDVELPYANPVQTVVEVKVAGEAVTTDDYRLLETTPAALRFDSYTVVNDEPAIEVSYNAGFGANASDVPQEIRTAVTMVADYLYNVRGGCSAFDAIKNSGAAALLQPYRTKAVIL